MTDNDIRDFYNYMDTLEKEGKEFKGQVNELQLQKNNCESLNKDLSSLAATSSFSAVILFVLLVYVVFKKK